MRIVYTFSFLLLLFVASTFAQTGKITGVVKDAATGEALFGTNVIIEGTTLGAASDIDGYYVILNVPPGTYSLKASSIGYTGSKIQDVRVSINQTTEINIAMKSATVTTQEIVVVAQKPIVQKDVSASTVNLNIQEIQNLPVVSVSKVLALQAGIQGGTDGLVVRGGSADQTAFMVNGVSMADERNGISYTGVSFTSIEEVQVQTGGYNAEYGNIQSGLVNVVTREGKKDKYFFSFQGRYSPTAPKHFGDAAHSSNSFWIRPFTDPSVAWVGTKTGWANDPNLQKQYPEFAGWIETARQYNDLKNKAGYGNYYNDLTPLGAQQLYLYQHRRVLDIDKPDWDVDVTFGGPVPQISEYLGNLRFMASFRKSVNQYLIPLSTDALEDYSGQIKVTSDIMKGMKLNIEGLIGRTTGTTRDAAGNPLFFRTPENISANLSMFSQFKTVENRIFATDYWCPQTNDVKSLGLKLTHVLTPETFYEVQMSAFQSKNKAVPGRDRDTSRSINIGGLWVDEAPYGFTPEQTFAGINNFRTSVGFSNGRDTSTVTRYTMKFDITSQIDKYNQVKTGFEMTYSDQDVHAGSVDKFLTSGRYLVNYQKQPIRAALYLQDKFEYEGMIANLGLRMDYSHAGGDWYVYEDWSSAFQSPSDLTKLETEPTKKRITLSPRLGIAFPITEDSKLFFNYGHFHQMPDPQALYYIGRYTDQTQQIFRMPDPNAPLQRTIAYELGYEQNLMDQFLVRIAGYYKDVTNQPYSVNYISDVVDYTVREPRGYYDIRGFEVTLTKNRGEWVSGFLNYTYMVSTNGHFGYSRYYDVVSTQKNYENATADNQQSKPVPQPFARANVDFFTPVDFGPKYGDMYLLGDWRLNILANWSSGSHFTWTGGPGALTGVENNIQWKDYFNIDLRISKKFKFGPANVEFFVDISNALNIKRMSGTGYAFVESNDYYAYMQSLHLSKDVFSAFPKDADGNPKPGYSNTGVAGQFIFGDDRPGDYRTGDYIPWDENASEAQKDEWRKNKSYIDMPNQEYLTFLNPRDIFWGLRLSFELF